VTKDGVFGGLFVLQDQQFAILFLHLVMFGDERWLPLRYLMFVLLACLTSVIGNTWGYLASAAGGRAEYAFAVFLLTVFPFMIFNGCLAALVALAAAEYPDPVDVARLEDS